MTGGGAVATGDRATLLAVVESACATLDAARGRIDDLNVFPVPDGDTGANMARTAAAVAEALRDPAARAAGPAEAVTRAALRGARGNSGIILSQIVRGAASVLGARELDGEAVADAFAAARDAAYGAVGEPVEGTMLTVVAAMAEGAARLQPAALEATLAAALAAGEEALARTPALLPLLAEAGVVDAGGAGVVELVRGLLAGLGGEPPGTRLADVAAHVADGAHAAGSAAIESRFRYCTSFLVEGAGVARGVLEQGLAPLGDSLLVVGAPPAFRVHVHTDDPGGALRVGTALGGIAGVEISDMHAQIAARRARLAPERPCDVVFVADGAGTRALAASLGARAVVGPGDPVALAAAVEGAHAAAVVVLPNGAGTAHLEDAARPLYVLASPSEAAGLCALVAYLPDASADENVSAMRAVLDGVRVAEVCADEADPAAALGAAAATLLAGGGEVLTVLLGEGEHAGGRLAAAAARLADSDPALEVAVYEGGQSGALALLALE